MKDKSLFNNIDCCRDGGLKFKFIIIYYIISF